MSYFLVKHNNSKDLIIIPHYDLYNFKILPKSIKSQQEYCRKYGIDLYINDVIDQKYCILPELVQKMKRPQMNMYFQEFKVGWFFENSDYQNIFYSGNDIFITSLMEQNMFQEFNTQNTVPFVNWKKPEIYNQRGWEYITEPRRTNLLLTPAFSNTFPQFNALSDDKRLDVINGVFMMGINKKFGQFYSYQTFLQLKDINETIHRNKNLSELICRESWHFFVYPLELHAYMLATKYAQFNNSLDIRNQVVYNFYGRHFYSEWYLNVLQNESKMIHLAGSGGDRQAVMERYKNLERLYKKWGKV